jgi:hypothetical protein
MFGEMSLVPATDELRAHRRSAPEPVAKGRGTLVGSVSDLFEEAPPLSHSDTEKGRLLPTVVSASPEPVRREHRVKPMFPIGILFYLASIGIVAAATVGVLFGIGFALLVQPTDALGAGAAAHSHRSSVRSLFYGLVPNFFGETVVADTKVATVPIKPELPRSTAPADVHRPAVAQPPAADQMPSPEQNGAVPPSAVADAPGGEANQPPAEEEERQAEAGGTTDASVPVVVARDPPSNTAIPAATAAPPSLPAVEVAELLARGDGYLGKGDVTSARLFYERAADAGSGQGAMRLGATFDPSFLGRAGLVGTRGDQAKADMWYQRARGLDTAAAAREPNRRETNKEKVSP